MDPRHDHGCGRRIAHGGGCECELLAAALGCDPCAITFEFCRRVLQQHWKLTCRHGRPPEAAAPAIAQRWNDIGPADAVKAILIRNAPEQD